MPVRVASWPPWYAPNRYIGLFHAALEPHGIEHVPGLPLDADEMARRQVHVAHLHWVEWAWQSRGRAAWRQRRGLGALTRFLDAAERRRIPVAWTVHNLATHEGLAACDQAGFRAMHQRAALRIFHSGHVRTEALRIFGGTGDTLVMPLGNYDAALPPPRARDAVRAELGISPRAPLLLCSGNVRRYKGFDLAAAALGASARTDLHLVIAGRCRDGALARALGDVARATRRVHLELVLLDDARYADLLHAADAVLLPYREVTGSAALAAALSAGRGVITSDLPYFREVLAPEPAAGVVAASLAPHALAAAMDEFLSIDVGHRGAAARRLADRCAWPAVVPPVAAWLRAHAPP